ncbi:DUF177 domain-containing protein [Corynebacterium hindlerae]|uniref:DUF177 domain-containing protein n=1 Tax=Corynebacterium hindlerae TaxID=699041 RepID=A0A7G5FIG8_9CORY|nr:YceD family protein [Corynebacterium hindlerae]QMV86409.1 DUF177 domain-containing protein [Corynebacterium hindlerae]
MPEHRTQTGPSPQRIGAEMIAIAEGEDVVVDATLTPLGEGIMVDAVVKAPLTGQCVRCLNPLAPTQEFHINEVFAVSADFIQGDESDEDDVPMVEGDQIDLLQSIIDAAGLELPFNPVCEYFDLQCGAEDVPAPDGISGEEDDRPDPRWAGLEKFK